MSCRLFHKQREYLGFKKKKLKNLELLRENFTLHWFVHGLCFIKINNFPYAKKKGTYRNQILFAMLLIRTVHHGCLNHTHIRLLCFFYQRYLFSFLAVQHFELKREKKDTKKNLFFSLVYIKNINGIWLQFSKNKNCCHTFIYTSRSPLISKHFITHARAPHTRCEAFYFIFIRFLSFKLAWMDNAVSRIFTIDVMGAAWHTMCTHYFLPDFRFKVSGDTPFICLNSSSEYRAFLL